MDIISYYNSPIGKITLLSRDGALIGLWFEGQKHYGAGEELSSFEEGECPVIARTKELLDKYFVGEKPDFSEIPLSYGKSSFSRAVLDELRNIPYGKAVSYGEIGAGVSKVIPGKRISARAVGGAVGKNPISIIIPCHRVIRADGTLGGYDGGVERKLFLLKHEGML